MGMKIILRILPAVALVAVEGMAQTDPDNVPSVLWKWFVRPWVDNRIAPAWTADPAVADYLAIGLHIALITAILFAAWPLLFRVWHRCWPSLYPEVSKVQKTGDPPVSVGSVANPRGDRDVWMYDAICRILYGSWDKKIPSVSDPGETIDDRKLSEVFFKAIPQAALDGHLPIWGKPHINGHWTDIPAVNWSHLRMDYFSLLRAHPDKPQELKTERGQHSFNNRVWHELKTSRIKVDELWPVASI